MTNVYLITMLSKKQPTLGRVDSEFRTTLAR